MQLGLMSVNEGDEELVKELFSAMEVSAADFNHTFKSLTELAKDESNFDVTLNRILEHVGTIPVLAKRYQPKIDPAQMPILLMMIRENPQQYG